MSLLFPLLLLIQLALLVLIVLVPHHGRGVESVNKSGRPTVAKHEPSAKARKH